MVSEDPVSRSNQIDVVAKKSNSGYVYCIP